jgi:hypothetical protein
MQTRTSGFLSYLSQNNLYFTFLSFLKIQNSHLQLGHYIEQQHFQTRCFCYKISGKGPYVTLFNYLIFGPHKHLL